MNVEHTPERGTYVLSTQMAEDYTPPSSSLNPAATLDKVVIDDYEARFREYEDKVHSLAADLLEERQKRRDEEGQRREVGEALVRVTEERDGWKEAVDRLTRRGIEHAVRHQKLFDEWLHERADLVDEGARYRLAWKSARKRARRLDDVAEELDERWYAKHREAQQLHAERDEALDEVVRLSRNPESQTSAFREERETLNAELVRLRTIIVELGAGEAAEPPEQRPEDVISGLCESGPDKVTCVVQHPTHREIYHGGRPAPEGIEALRPEGER